MKVRILSAADVTAAIDMASAIEAVRGAFVELCAGGAVVPLRLALETPGGTALFMPGHLSGSGATAAKVVTIHPGNAERGLPSIHAVVLVLDPRHRQAARAHGRDEVDRAAYRSGRWTRGGPAGA